MSVMRSSAAFADKVRGFGIEGDQAKAINDKYKTIGAFVVCCGYNAERVTDEMLIDKVVKETCGWSGTPPEPAYANNVRQLFWECLNMQMADTRYRHESCADEAPRPINALEREDRRDKISRCSQHCEKILRWQKGACHNYSQIRRQMT